MKACVAITSYFGQNVEKKITSFWVTNGTEKTKLLNDQVRSITHEVELSALTHEGPLVSTDRYE